MGISDNTGRDANTVDSLINGLRPTGRSLGSAAGKGGFGSKRQRAIGATGQPLNPWIARGCVAIGVVLGSVMPSWPYGRDCGWGLVFYSVCLAVLVITTLWSMVLTWETQLGVSHVVALVALLWSLVLVAQVILPRVGYAAVEAAWTCPG